MTYGFGKITSPPTICNQPSGISHCCLLPRHLCPAASLRRGEPDGAGRRFLLQDLDLRSWRDFREPARELVREPRHHAKHAAGQVERERVAAHLETRRHRPRAEAELVGRALEDPYGDRIAV